MYGVAGTPGGFPIIAPKFNQRGRSQIDLDRIKYPEPGSPGCVLMPREKGTEKVHLLRSIAPRFRNRARADLERFQRRADRALWRAIAKTKRKDRKKRIEERGIERGNERK